MDKIWSKTELAHLKRQANNQSIDDLAQRFHTDPGAVRRKIEELGLDNSASAAGQVDASIEMFAKASAFLQDKKWQKAADLFGRIVEESDSRQVVDRARQFLLICQQAIAGPQKIEDPYLAAVCEKNDGNLDRALEICLTEGDVATTEERFAYLVASIYALQENGDEATASLSIAIDLEAKNRVHAFHDPDFEEVRSHEGFAELVQVTSAPAEEVPEADSDADGDASSGIESMEDGFVGTSDAILAPADA